jgi:2-amino-4-hydroxy-6-hydroxymethyldihydropteridine diphosphokinase
MPVGDCGSGRQYHNGCFELETTLGPRELFDRLRRLEEEYGRVRMRRWDAREIDLDLVLFGEEVVDEADLAVPHPRMHFRRFVLAPVAELNAAIVHRVLRASAGALLQLMDSPDCPLVVVGGSDELLARARERHRASWPGRPVVHCRTELVCLRKYSVGQRVVGASPVDCRLLEEAFAGRLGWLVLLETPPLAAGSAAAMMIVPVADCRAEAPDRARVELDDFFDSLARLIGSDGPPLCND